MARSQLGTGLASVFSLSQMNGNIEGDFLPVLIINHDWP